MNRKEHRLALRTAFNSRSEDWVVVEDFAEQLPRPKTKDFIDALGRWGVEPKAKMLLILHEIAPNVELSTRNIANLIVIKATNLNVHDILWADKIVVTSQALGTIQEVYSD